MTNDFRYDINGLRAYAVILVVLFHFGILGFSSGFIGVDIFFIISGFLMTSIVIRGLEKENFSIFRFYISRGIRIIPALLILCLTLLIIGWIYLLPQDYRSLGKHTVSSVNFFSNIIYWKESGYFDTDSHNKSLLHTWSLSVEWQFYLIFPLVVAFLYKIKPSRNFLLLSFILTAIISFLLSIIITDKSPSSGFFLLPTRAWELLLGGLIFFIPKDKVPAKKLLEIVGFGFVALSCYLFSTNTIWPSYNALIPVFGAFLIVLANQQNSCFTKGKIFQWLGNNSYSIYLWHWPIVFAINYIEKSNSIAFIISGLFLSVGLGHLSYRFVELKSKIHLSSIKPIKAFSYLACSIALLTFVSFYIYKNNGIYGRFNSQIDSIQKVAIEKNPRREECVTSELAKKINVCSYGNGPISLIVIGDSHSDAMLSGVLAALPKNTSLIHLWSSNCPTVLGLKEYNRTEYNCGNLVQQFIDYSKNFPKTPILVINRVNLLFSGEKENNKGEIPKKYISHPYTSFSREYLNEIQNNYLLTLQELSKNHLVYVTRPTPEAWVNIPNLQTKYLIFGIGDINRTTIPKYKYDERSAMTIQTQDIAARSFGIKIINISKYFCDDKNCYFTKNGISIFSDDNHMGWNAATSLADYFKVIFK